MSENAAQNVTNLFSFAKNMRNDAKAKTLQIHHQQIQNLGRCQIRTKITCSWCGFVLVVFLGFAKERVGGCPNNPDAAIREKVSKKAMVVTGSLNQPALLTSSRATLPRKSSTCESTYNPQRC